MKKLKMGEWREQVEEEGGQENKLCIAEAHSLVVQLVWPLVRCSCSPGFSAACTLAAKVWRTILAPGHSQSSLAQGGALCPAAGGLRQSGSGCSDVLRGACV